MRLFRDSTFTAWALVLVAMAAVYAVAVGAGGPDTAVPRLGSHHASVRAADHSDAKTAVEELRSLASTGVAAGTDPTALTGWAELVAGHASDGVDARTSEGAGDGDQLLSHLAAIRDQAAHLIAVAGDPVKAASTRTAILLHLDQATNAVTGLGPAVDLPEDMGGHTKGDAPTLPVAPTPARPSIPADKAQNPHPAPLPSLDLSTPVPGDLS